jgi:predicted RecA/RadA family phage recombinase
MNNFVHEGHFLEVTAPYDVTNGDGLLRGALFGIATSWARQGETVSISTAGVFDLKRGLEEHWEVGEPIYWDDVAKRFTREARGAVMVGFAVCRTRGQDHPWVRGKLIGHAAAWNSGNGAA